MRLVVVTLLLLPSASALAGVSPFTPWLEPINEPRLSYVSRLNAVQKQREDRREITDLAPPRLDLGAGSIKSSQWTDIEADPAKLRKLPLARKHPRPPRSQAEAKHRLGEGELKRRVVVTKFHFETPHKSVRAPKSPW